MGRVRVVLLLLVALLVPALAVGKVSKHERLQHRLAHSRFLWATVNFCDSRHHPNAMGVRVSMPGTYRSSNLLMYVRFQVQYFSTVKRNRGWRKAPGGRTDWFFVGDAKQTSRQFGYTVRYDPQGFRFRARAFFQWRVRGKVAFTANELTQARHHNAAGSDPPGWSTRSCVIRR